MFKGNSNETEFTFVNFYILLIPSLNIRKIILKMIR